MESIAFYDSFIGPVDLSGIASKVSAPKTVSFKSPTLQKLLDSQLVQAGIKAAQPAVQQAVTTQVNRLLSPRQVIQSAMQSPQTSAAMLPKTRELVAAERVMSAAQPMVGQSISFKTPLIIGGVIVGMVVLFLLFKY